MRNRVIYIIHSALVALTAWVLILAGVTQWYWTLVIAAPLFLALTPSLSSFSYTLNVRVLLPISVGAFIVSLFHYFPNLVDASDSTQLARYGISNSDLEVDASLFEVNPIFKDAVSVLYAICAAFLLWKGLNDFDELKSVIYEEVAEVCSISDYLNYFLVGAYDAQNQIQVKMLREELLKYLENMLHNGKEIRTSAENEQVLERIIIDVGRLNSPDQNDKIALEEIMKGVSHLGLLRSKRTVCIEKRMSPFILSLILIMSLTMVASFFNKATGQIGIDYLYVFLLPTFYASIFMTLIDLSSPFDGYWSIKLHAIEGVQKKLKAQIQRDRSPS